MGAAQPSLEELAHARGAHSAQLQAAERATMRRWLISKGCTPSRGCNLAVTEKLMNEVSDLGGVPEHLMILGRGRILKERRGF